ncbi:MAG TPA: SGNH/GDSL hydrolase family protein [Tepidisphaeraceae bacterium]|jgi:lysophospholipase L1-like esterase|nr:SGNH/GDSL hydrolase family protein [Tepidisphaeraceae bacterium]
MNRFHWLLVLIGMLGSSIAGNLCASAAEPGYAIDQPLPVEISPADANVRHVGRFDASDAKQLKYAWPASAITLHFTGSSLNMKLTDNGNNRHEVIVDGKIGPVLVPKAGTHLYRLAGDLSPGEHTVTLIKRTEANVGTVGFDGAQLGEGGKLLPVKPAAHRIEVIGDSISCGYGNEGANQNEHFSPATENACETYGAITARAFDADFVDIAWSGRKMWPNFTIPEIYDRTLPDKSDSKWDFDAYKPEVILINLATNDFGQGNPDEEGWVKAYEQFVAHLRAKNPDATIYLALGPMMSDGWPKGQMALSTARKYINRVVSDRAAKGDMRVHFLEFKPQDANKDGLGSDWHPNVKTHQLMADVFIEAIARDLKWKHIDGAKE